MKKLNLLKEVGITLPPHIPDKFLPDCKESNRRIGDRVHIAKRALVDIVSPRLKRLKDNDNQKAGESIASTYNGYVLQPGEEKIGFAYSVFNKQSPIGIEPRHLCCYAIQCNDGNLKVIAPATPENQLLLGRIKLYEGYKLVDPPKIGVDENFSYTTYNNEYQLEERVDEYMILYKEKSCNGQKRFELICIDGQGKEIFKEELASVMPTDKKNYNISGKFMITFAAKI